MGDKLKNVSLNIWRFVESVPSIKNDVSDNCSCPYANWEKLVICCHWEDVGVENRYFQRLALLMLSDPVT